MTRIRRNVWNLPAGDDTLLWYGRAIGDMLRRPINNPTGWRFQAAIHEYDRTRDPLKRTGESLPSTAIRRRFWTQCQHGSWYFLPWHRMYLHFFEKIVAATVQRLGGPANWALPYWDYSSSTQARLLPPAFRQPTNPDGTRNFLFVAQRDPRANLGQQFADAGDVALRVALTQGRFSDVVLGNFGGLATNFSHSGSSGGVLESTPHGSVHVAVGGGNGWMSGFTTAGLDPIFWLHHCNLDRLWEVWLRRDPTHRNPTSLQWSSNIAFEFFETAGAQVSLRCGDVVNTTALDYEYQDVSDPLAAAGGVVFDAAANMEMAMAESIPPEMMGATDTSVRVKNEPIRISVPTPLHSDARARRADAVAASPQAAAADEAVQAGHVLLRLENITARGQANSFDVYVNVPEGQDPTAHPERLAGRIDMFGVAEASRATADHPGSGLNYTFDITDIYNRLAGQEGWSQDNVNVDLVPVRAWQGAPADIGRVSLFLG